LGAIDPETDKVSVFMRGSAIEVDSIRISVSSVITHMPGAIEIVIVVPDHDLSMTLALLPAEYVMHILFSRNAFK
jgi:hypothetical protein